MFNFIYFATTDKELETGDISIGIYRLWLKDRLSMLFPRPIFVIFSSSTVRSYGQLYLVLMRGIWLVVGLPLVTETPDHKDSGLNRKSHDRKWRHGNRKSRDLGWETADQLEKGIVGSD